MTEALNGSTGDNTAFERGGVSGLTDEEREAFYESVRLTPEEREAFYAQFLKKD